MGDGVLDETLWLGEFLLIRFLGSEHTVFKFLWLGYIEGNPQLAEGRGGELKKKNEQGNTNRIISFQSHGRDAN